MLATSASRPAMFNETMRRVRLEKLSANRNWPARCSQPGGRGQLSAGVRSSAALPRTTGAGASSAFRPGSGCVRSSKVGAPSFSYVVYPPRGQRQRCPDVELGAIALAPDRSALLPQEGIKRATPRAPPFVSGFLEAVADAVEGLDHLEILVDGLELLAQPLDVAVDGTVI